MVADLSEITSCCGSPARIILPRRMALAEPTSGIPRRAELARPVTASAMRSIASRIFSMELQKQSRT
jgi:hypothetical protein